MVVVGGIVMNIYDQLMKAKPNQCRWISGDGDNRVLCEEMCEKGSYCKDHSEIVYFKRKEKEESSQ